MDDWRDVILEEIADDVTVGHVGPMAAQYCDEGIPFLRSLSIEPFRITKEGLKYISANFHARLPKSALAPGDVVIVRTGKPGASAVIPDWLPVANCSDLIIIRCSNAIRPRYLCYVINSIASHHIDTHLVGAVQQHFNVGSARTLRFRLPRLDDQDAILSILGALDDKIELNRRMNATLEAMARALFKDWFVDFGPTRAKAEGRPPYLAPDLWALFPDALDGDDKPVGWEVKSLRDVTTEIRRGIGPKYCDQGGIRVLNQKCVRDRRIKLSLARRHDTSVRSVDGRMLHPGDLLVNSTGVGTLGRAAQVWTLDEPTIVDSHLTIVRTDTAKARLHYFGLNLTGREAEIEELGEGSTGQTELSRVRLGDLPILIPIRDVQDAFETVVSPLSDRREQNEQQSKTIVALRDLILPKLMSGEIRLRDAEKSVEAVA
ncbi:MAG: restriction endonuclease subunit S [Rhodospirillales bacterium]